MERLQALDTSTRKDLGKLLFFFFFSFFLLSFRSVPGVGGDISCLLGFCEGRFLLYERIAKEKTRQEQGDWHVDMTRLMACLYHRIWILLSLRMEFVRIHPLRTIVFFFWRLCFLCFELGVCVQVRKVICEWERGRFETFDVLHLVDFEKRGGYTKCCGWMWGLG